MKFVIKDVNSRPWAEFPEENETKGWLLSAFLEDARANPKDYLDEISRAEQNPGTATGYTGNHVDVEFNSDRAVIEDLYPEPPDDEPEKIEISLADAKQLLLDWEAAIKDWKPQKS